LYYCGNGTNYEDGSGNVCFYLGSGASSSVWNRFERNIEEDWESVSAATWSNTDGLLIRPDSAASYDFYIDHLRFSNSRTKVHNTLSGSSVGQIVSAKNYMSDTYGQPQDAWYIYDHNGNVVNLSDAAGDKTTEYAQDAFGNVLSSALTGVWATSADGRHLTTKEYDDNVEFYYFWQRWYDPQLGRFLSKTPYPFNVEHSYSYCINNPNIYVDTNGKLPKIPGIGIIIKKPTFKEIMKYAKLLRMTSCLSCLAGLLAIDAGCGLDPVCVCCQYRGSSAQTSCRLCFSLIPFVISGESLIVEDNLCGIGTNRICCD
jgi:RHS repeat-associated protein